MTLRANEIESWFRRYVEKELGVDPARVEPGLDLAAVGIDSLEAVTLVGDLERWLEKPLSPTLLWDCETIADFLEAVVTGKDPSRTKAPTDDDESQAHHPYRRFVNPHLGKRLRQIRIDKQFVRGEGSTLYDHEGRAYLDFTAQLGALPFGYNPDQIWDALYAVRAEGAPSFVQPSALEAAGELARRLIEIAPGNLRTVTFTNSGAEAIEAAIKLCRHATGRNAVLSTNRGFHGKTLGALSASGNSEYQEPFGLPLPGFDRVPFGDEDALRDVLNEHPARYAAFLVEPIQGEGGIDVPPPGYLARAHELCKAHGVLLVVDEVQTGLGRTGALFACESEGVEPDVLALAKALGGGLMPIGACLSTREVYREKFGLKHSSTFAGNTLAARAGLATLDLLAADDGALLRSVRENGAFLKSALEDVRQRFPALIGEIRGRGFLLGIRFGVRREQWPENFLGVAAEQKELVSLFASYLLNVEAVRLAPTLNRGDVLRVEPPLTASRAECEQVVAAVERACEALAPGDTGSFYGSILDQARREPSAVVRPTTTTHWRAPDDARFAFILHPLDAASFVDFDPTLGSLSEPDLAEFVESMDGIVDPFVGSEARIVSKAGPVASGDFIVLSRTADSLVSLPQGQVLDELIGAVDLAKRRGAQIVGLGAYASVLSRGGLKLADEGVPITSGNSYTVVAGTDAVELALNRLGRGWEGATVAIVGAAGSIGRGVAMLVAEKASRLILIGNPDRSEVQSHKRLLGAASQMCFHLAAEAISPESVVPGSVAEQMRAMPDLPPPGSQPAAFQTVAETLMGKLGCLLMTRTRDLLAHADIVFIATSFPGAVLESADLKPGAVICDMSRPRGVPSSLREERPDVLLIDGGLVEIPGRPNLGPYGLEPGLAYACVAETIMLALQHRFEHTSLGANLSLNGIIAMRQLAERHGFAVAELQGFGRQLVSEDWQRLRRGNVPGG